MTIQDIARTRCVQERNTVRFAFDTFVAELEQINTERGLLLQESTRAFEAKAANKFRSNISQLLDHGSK